MSGEYLSDEIVVTAQTLTSTGGWGSWFSFDLTLDFSGLLAGGGFSNPVYTVPEPDLPYTVADDGETITVTAYDFWSGTAYIISEGPNSSFTGTAAIDPNDFSMVPYLNYGPNAPALPDIDIA
jgi:hypothetical protein